MTLQYVRGMYGVPAEAGRRVEAYYNCGGEWHIALRGKLAAKATHYVWIESDAGGTFGPFHPTYGMVYLDDEGAVLHDTRKCP